MIKKIFLHIGFPKTGTSYIQNRLFEEQNTLKKTGYLYPQNGLISFSHHNLVYELLKERKASPKFGLFSDLIQEMNDSSCNQFIISSEDFIKLKLSEIIQLRKLLKDFEVIIVVCFRRQDDFLASLWSHEITNNQMKLSFPDFVTKKLSLGKRMNIENESYTNDDFYPDYNYYYHLWGNIFEHKNIRVLLYDIFNNNLLQEFLTICDIKKETINELLQQKDRKNQSPGYSLLELSRFLHNHYAKKVPKIVELMVDKSIKKFARNRTSDSTSNKVGFVTKEISEKVMHHFEESNINLARSINKPDVLFSKQNDFGLMDIEVDKLTFEEYGQLLSIIINTLTYTGLIDTKGFKLLNDSQMFLMNEAIENKK